MQKNKYLHTEQDKEDDIFYIKEFTKAFEDKYKDALHLSIFNFGELDGIEDFIYCVPDAGSHEARTVYAMDSNEMSEMIWLVTGINPNGIAENLFVRTFDIKYKKHVKNKLVDSFYGYALDQSEIIGRFEMFLTKRDKNCGAEMKIKSFQQLLDQIASQRIDNLKKLLAFSEDRLNALKEYYYKWYKYAEEIRDNESAIIKQIHYHLIEEAINIKQWNDEQKESNEAKTKYLEEEPEEGLRPRREWEPADPRVIEAQKNAIKNIKQFMKYDEKELRKRIDLYQLQMASAYKHKNGTAYELLYEYEKQAFTALMAKDDSLRVKKKRKRSSTL
ncbi:MAG: hypothetical protein WCS69_10670 [Ignavibacteriaceae bacterium]|jgi:hypothetical protein